MSNKTRLDKLENRAATAAEQPPLVLYPVEGKPGFWHYNGRHCERGGPDWPKDIAVMYVVYNRGKHEQV